MKTTHEVARELLELPDVPLVIGDNTSMKDLHEHACENCCFWKRFHDLKYSSVTTIPPKNYRRGNCFRQPPVVVADNGIASSRWPDSDQSDWCGEYRKRPHKSSP